MCLTEDPSGICIRSHKEFQSTDIDVRAQSPEMRLLQVIHTLQLLDLQRPSQPVIIITNNNNLKHIWKTVGSVWAEKFEQLPASVHCWHAWPDCLFQKLSSLWHCSHCRTNHDFYLSQSVVTFVRLTVKFMSLNLDLNNYLKAMTSTTIMYFIAVLYFFSN